MARVPYLDAKDIPADAAPARPLNIRRALANSPRRAAGTAALAMYIRHKSRLDPRLREIGDPAGRLSDALRL